MGVVIILSFYMGKLRYGEMERDAFKARLLVHMPPQLTYEVEVRVR